jgi:polysaccharide pyruvyl transferase WcaK-like protein
MILKQAEKMAVREAQKVSSSPKKIGLMGPWGHGNLGDASIQDTMIRNIRKYHPDAQIYGISIYPEDTQARHNIPSFTMCSWPGNNWWTGDGKNAFVNGLSRISDKVRAISNPWLRKLFIPVRVPSEFLLELLALLRSYRSLKGFDLLIVSGGGQLDDVFNGAWFQPYALLRWGIFARLRNVRYAMVSIGAGPIDQPLSKFFIKYALALTNYCSYRDFNSKKYVEQVVNFYRNDPIFPDPAHSLDIAKYQTNSREDQRTIVGIGPIPHKYPGTPPGLPGGQNETYTGYLEKLAVFVDWLLQNQYVILFFTNEDCVDRQAVQDLRATIAELGTSYSKDQIIEEPIASVDELLTQLARTDLVVASRFHGVLLSQLMNKPVVALSFYDKIDSLMVDTGQAEYCLSIDQFDVDTLKERFIALEKNQENIKKQLAEKTQEYKAALEKQYEYLFKNL